MKSPAASFFSAHPPNWISQSTVAAFPIVACYQSIGHEQQYADLDERLREFLGLSENWDGYGAPAISSETINHVRGLVQAHRFVSSGCSLPEVVPTSIGTIAMEWRTPDGVAYVEVGESQVSGFVRTRSNDPVFLAGQFADLRSYLPAAIHALMRPIVGTAINPISKVAYNPLPHG
jgi:hypothetical protein